MLTGMEHMHTVKRGRFTVVSVPTNGDGAFWFVMDLQTRRSREVASYDAALAEVRRLNKGL